MMRSLPLAARGYVVAVILLGMAIVLAAASEVDTWITVTVLAALVVGSEALSTTLSRSVSRGSDVGVSVTTPIVIASVLLLGPWGAALVGAASALEISRLPLLKRAFNGAQMAIAAFAAGWVYVSVGGQSPLTSFSPRGVLLPMLLGNAAFEMVNGLLVVGVISLVEKVSAARVWTGTMRTSALPYFVYSVFGLLLAVVWSSGVGPFAAVLVLAPLLVARWVFALYAAEQEAYDSTIRSLIQAVETKDSYTRGHSERVARASVMIGRRIGMREDRVQSLRYAGILHDVGKLGVPTRVLQKAGRLDDDEFAAIQLHPVRGREITHDLDFLGEAVEGIYHHHERLDGRGYPLGLAGDDIPEFARVIAVADAFDSMTTTRSYRGARPLDDAILELDRCRGTQFDPVMVDAMTAALAEEGWTREVGLEPIADPSPYSVPTYGRDDDDPTSGADLAAAASEAPARAEEATVADTAAEVDEAMADLWGLEYRLARESETDASEPPA